MAVARGTIPNSSIQYGVAGLPHFVMVVLVTTIHTLPGRGREAVEGRDKPDQDDAGACGAATFEPGRTS